MGLLILKNWDFGIKFRKVYFKFSNNENPLQIFSIIYSQVYQMVRQLFWAWKIVSRYKWIFRDVEIP